MQFEMTPLLLSLQLALYTTIVLFVLSLPLAYFLASRKSPFRMFIETLVNLPLVLPPTVLGFYFLVFLSPRNFIGSFFEHYFDIRLSFSMAGMVIASIMFSAPFMVIPIKNAIESLDKNLLDAAATLGQNRVKTFFRVILPNIKPALITSPITTFAHTIGEFGVVLMVGGNMPGKTQVVSIAIYERVEQLKYAEAHFYAATLVVFSLAVIYFTIMVNYFKANRNKAL